MAKKRMFSLDVIDTDTFIEMPISSRLLYYELGMRADDDGFVNNWRKIMAFTGLKEDDLKILITKKYVIPFDSGVIVIRHWRMNNYLQNDRKKATIYKEELKNLHLDNNSVYNLDTKCIHSIDEYRVEENSIVNNTVDDDIERIDNKTASPSINDLQEQEYQTSKLLIDDNLERPDNKTSELSKGSNQERFENKTSELPSVTIFEYLETNFGRTISPREFEIINSYRDIFTLDIIKEAIDRACINNAKTIHYVMGILNSWESKGFKKIEECKAEFKQNKKFQINQNIASVPEWFDKKIETKSATIEEKKEIEKLLSEYK